MCAHTRNCEVALSRLSRHRGDRVKLAFKRLPLCLHPPSFFFSFTFALAVTLSLSLSLLLLLLFFSAISLNKLSGRRRLEFPRKLILPFYFIFAFIFCSRGAAAAGRKKKKKDIFIHACRLSRRERGKEGKSGNGRSPETHHALLIICHGNYRKFRA